jgi:SIR2-like domain
MRLEGVAMLQESMSGPGQSSQGLDEINWDALLLAIKHHRCTPFLGAGACAGILPSGRKLASDWAEEFRYPFTDREDLPRVAQYLMVQNGANFPRLKIVELFDGLRGPDYDQPNEIHRVLARLELPLYITTNYDSFMAKALERMGKRPRREYCKWHLLKRSSRGLKVDSVLNATPGSPVVFHLHGILEQPESMVLTEDDYLDFLCIEGMKKLIPFEVEKAFADSSLLFLGYSLEDMNFKVLFRKLASYIDVGMRHIAVQLDPKGPDAQKRYLENYFRQKRIQIFWGTCEGFISELRRRGGF